MDSDGIRRLLRIIRERGYEKPREILEEILIDLEADSAYLYIRDMLCYVEPCDEDEETYSFRLHEN